MYTERPILCIVFKYCRAESRNIDEKTFIKRSKCSVTSASSCLNYIMLTCPCNEDPLTPHFLIVKFGFTGVYIIFSFLLKYIDCAYTLELPHPTIYVLEQK